jgi:hypothetical protein
MTLLLTLLLAASPSLDDALTHIRQNVEFFENQVPDFICTEKIVSRTISEPDDAVKETVVESTFSGRQHRSKVGIRYSTTFAEDRKIETVNSAPWKRKSFPRGVFLIGGAYSSALVTIFGKESDRNYFYLLGAGDRKGPKGAIAISFATKTDNQRILEKDGAHVFHETGCAWFDPVTFEIVRLERLLIPQDGLGGELPITIDYLPFRIGENTFRLPSHVSSSSKRVAAGTSDRGVYEADYTNYRKYGSTTSIQFADDPK